MRSAGIILLLTSFSSACKVSKPEVECEVSVYYGKEDCYNGSWVHTFRHDIADNEFARRPQYFEIKDVFFTSEKGPLLNLSITLPTTEVSGLVVLLTNSTDLRCYIFNFSKPVNSSEMVNVTTTVGEVSEADALHLRAYSLPMWGNDLDKNCFRDIYVSTARQVHDSDPSAWWRTSIIYNFDSVGQTVWVNFVAAPRKYKLGKEYIVRLLKSQNHNVYLQSTVQEGHFHTFENITPGEYVLQVYPKARCIDKYGGDITCVRPMTSPFKITEDGTKKTTTDSVPAALEDYTSSYTVSVSYDWSNGLTDQPLSNLVTERAEALTSDLASGGNAKNKSALIIGISCTGAVIFLVILTTIVVMTKQKHLKAKRTGYLTANHRRKDTDSFSEHGRGDPGTEDKTTSKIRFDKSEDKEWYTVQHSYISEVLSKNVIQTGNFLVDPDDISVISPSICPAVTLLEVNLEDNIELAKETSFQCQLTKDTYATDHFKSSKMPDDFSFISPDVCGDDDESCDVTSYLQSEQILAFNKRYFDYLQQENKTKDDTETKKIDRINSLRDDEHGENKIESMQNFPSSMTPIPKCQVGVTDDHDQDERPRFDSGFYSSTDSPVGDTIEEEQSLGGVSI